MLKNFIIYSILLLREKDLTFKMRSKTTEIPSNVRSFEQIYATTRSVSYRR